MWKLIDNCGQQITLKTIIRETDNSIVKEYAITEIEFDQFHVNLLTKGGQPVRTPQKHILTCAQLVKFGFEYRVEEEKV